MKVFVYYNLHRACWSVKALEGEHKGRVVAHAQAVGLDGVEFKVSEAGRLRVLREQRKNVHAGAVGEWVWASGVEWRYDLPHGSRPGVVQQVPGRGAPWSLTGEHTAVSYNPRRGPSFYDKDTDRDVASALHADLTADRKVFAVGVAA